jgi:hypothetical protein
MQVFVFPLPFGIVRFVRRICSSGRDFIIFHSALAGLMNKLHNLSLEKFSTSFTRSLPFEELVLVICPAIDVVKLLMSHD